MISANQEMIKVLEPMSDLFLQCLPVFEKYPLKLSSIFVAAEELWADCAPDGAIRNKASDPNGHGSSTNWEKLLFTSSHFGYASFRY